MKKTSVTTIIKTDTYKLTDGIKYVKTYRNSKLVSKEISYTGEKIGDYHVSVLYKKDISLLKTWNPYWGEKPKEKSEKSGYEWLDNNFKTLPEPEDINIDNLILCQSASHSFFKLDKTPIPVVVEGNYIEAGLNNQNYDLVKLREHFLTHPNIVTCSEILDIPYYNAERGRNKYLEVLVYPTVEVLQRAYNEKKKYVDIKDHIFGKPWRNDGHDFLNIKQFRKNNLVD